MLLETSHNTPNSRHGRERIIRPQMSVGQEGAESRSKCGVTSPKAHSLSSPNAFQSTPPPDLSRVPQATGFRCLLP